MRTFILRAAAAALAFVAADAAPAKAQIVIGNGYSSPGYYGGTAAGGGGVVQSVGGQLLNQALGGSSYPAYSNGYGTYNGYSNYGGYQPYYGNGYNTSNSYYRGSTSYSSGRRGGRWGR